MTFSRKPTKFNKSARPASRPSGGRSSAPARASTPIRSTSVPGMSIAKLSKLVPTSASKFVTSKTTHRPAKPAHGPSPIPTKAPGEFPMRINKYLGWKGYSTRRGADELIARHMVTINGRFATLGDQVTASDTVEVRNTAIGLGALISNTSGGNNTGLGAYPLYANTTGSFNTAIGGYDGAGTAVMRNNTTGSYNIAVGNAALANNTTASNNTAVGYQAGYSNTTGASHVFIGQGSGYNNTTGTQNTFLGQNSGYSNTTGYNNVFIGNGSGYSMTTGNKNTIVGLYTGNGGGLDIRTSSNYIVLSDGDGNPRAYNNATNWYQGNNSTLWSITSDARIKKNVVSLESGLNIISALRPVEFDYIANDKHDIGFIAQEYQTVLPEQVNEKDDGMLSLTPNLVPYLVKAIQELNAKVTALEAKLGAK